MPDPQNGEVRLFRIILRCRATNWDDVWRDRTQNFGKPSEIDEQPFRTWMGTTFDYVTLRWENEESSIVAVKRYVQEFVKQRKVEAADDM